MKNFCPIPFATLVALFVLTAPGCQHPDQKPLTTLFEQIGEHVTGKLRPEITKLPSEQRSINLFRDQCRDECEVIDRFLQSNPELTADTKRIVVEFRNASNDAAEYYDSFITAKNYDLTDREREYGRQLLDMVLLKMGELAKIVDGKE